MNNCTCGVKFRNLERGYKAEECVCLLKNAKNMESFIKEIMQHRESGVDGGDLQDIAVNHGILVENNPTKSCLSETNECQCVEYYSETEFERGEVRCFRLAEFLE